ncbi:MAG: YdeI/OmpD-associated family protein [Bacteroidota bacterium]
MLRPIQTSNNGTCYLSFQPEEIAPFLMLESSKVKVSLNGEESFHAALMPKRSGEYFITIGKRIWAPLRLTDGDLVEVHLAVDDESYQVEAPAALMEVLNTDPEAQTIFEQLSPSRQRSLIYLIQGVHSLDKQIKRALRIAKSLKMGISHPEEVLKA